MLRLAVATCLALVSLHAAARAEPPSPGPAAIAGMLVTARAAAARGDCATVGALANRARAWDPAAYAAAFAVDPAVVACEAQRSPDDPAWPDHTSPGVAAAATSVASLAGIALGTTLFVTARPDASHADHAGRVVLGATAFAIGPTLGRLYDGHPWNRWLVTRAIGAALPLIGLVVDAHTRGEFSTSFEVGMVLGGATCLVGTVGDIASAPRTAIADNRARHPDPAVAILPLRAEGATGLALAGRF